MLPAIASALRQLDATYAKEMPEDTEARIAYVTARKNMLTQMAAAAFSQENYERTLGSFLGSLEEPPLHILEMAFSAGDSLAPFVKHFPEAEITILNPSTFLLDCYRLNYFETPPRFRYIEQDLISTDLEGQYDIIHLYLCLGSHLHSERKPLLLKCHKALKENGMLIITDQILDSALADSVENQYVRLKKALLAKNILETDTADTLIKYMRTEMEMQDYNSLSSQLTKSGYARPHVLFEDEITKIITATK